MSYGDPCELCGSAPGTEYTGTPTGSGAGLYACQFCFVKAWPANVHLIFHYGCPDWVAPIFQTPKWIQDIRHWFPVQKGVVHFFSRRVAETLLWMQQWDAGHGVFPDSPYSYRGWCRAWAGEIVILVDETETINSVQWLVLHELGHLACNNAKLLDTAMDKANEQAGRTVYEWKDDVGHEADSEEQLVNKVATAHMGGKEYARPWWRPRVNRLLAGEAVSHLDAD